MRGVARWTSRSLQGRMRGAEMPLRSETRSIIARPPATNAQGDSLGTGAKVRLVIIELQLAVSVKVTIPIPPEYW